MRTWGAITPSRTLADPRSLVLVGALVAPLLLLPATAGGRDIQPTAAAFLDIDVDARGVGMASTGWASTRDLQSAYSNPAGLSYLSGQHAGLMHAQWFEGLTLEWAGYGTRVADGTGLAVAATFLRSGSVDRYDAFGNPEGSFTVYDAALSASVGRRFDERLRAGLTAKILHQSIDDISATGIAADLGTTFETPHGTLAFVATNVGPDVTIEGESFPLPTAFALGISMPFFEERLRVNVGGNYPLNYYEDVRLGLEVRPVPALALRAGYRYVLEPGTDDQLTAMTYGVGVWASDIRFDYAFQPFDELGDTHRVGLTALFGGAPRAVAPGAPRTSTRPDDEAPRVAATAEPAPTPAASAAEEPPAPEPGDVAAEPARAAAPDTTPADATPVPAPPVDESVADAQEATRYLVVAGTHSSRISALKELRALRIGGLRGGTLQKLDDGRYRIVIDEFDSESDARKWIDGPGVKHGALAFSVVPLD